MAKVIHICGIERGDFPYYIAAILAENDNIVLVIDNSYTHDLFTGVSEDMDKDFVVKQNITYVKNKSFDSSEYEGAFEYVIVYHGMNILPETIKEDDIVYILPDYNPVSLKMIRSKLPAELNLNGIIFRDSVMSNKISDAKGAKMLGLKPEKVTYSLIYDSKDYENYLALIYNGRQKFTNLTPIYNECLIHAISEITGVDEKEATKMFKKARG